MSKKIIPSVVALVLAGGLVPAAALPAQAAPAPVAPASSVVALQAATTLQAGLVAPSYMNICGWFPALPGCPGA